MSMADINVKIMCENAQIRMEEISAKLEKDFQVSLRGLVVATFNEGKRLAMERSKSFAKDWLKAYNMYTLSENYYLLQLKDDPKEKGGLKPTMIEGGFPRFDMKKGLLNGPRSKAGKKGRYNTIPFEHSMSAQPTSLKASIRQEGFKAIVKEKNLKEIVRDIHGVPVQGAVARVRTGEKYNQLSDKTRRIMGSQAKNLDGLTKYQKTYDKKTEGSFFTFRRVSSNSKPSSWWHPGYEGVKVFPTLELYLNGEIRKMVDNLKSEWLQGAGKGKI